MQLIFRIVQQLSEVYETLLHSNSTIEQMNNRILCFKKQLLQVRPYLIFE